MHYKAERIRTPRNLSRKIQQLTPTPKSLTPEYGNRRRSPKSRLPSPRHLLGSHDRPARRPRDRSADLPRSREHHHHRPLCLSTVDNTLFDTPQRAPAQRGMVYSSSVRPGRQQCGKCGKYYSSKTKLRMHQMKKHSRELRLLVYIWIWRYYNVMMTSLSGWTLTRLSRYRVDREDNGPNIYSTKCERIHTCPKECPINVRFRIIAFCACFTSSINNTITYFAYLIRLRLSFAGLNENENEVIHEGSVSDELGTNN